MKVHVIGQTWEQRYMQQGGMSATDYTIPANVDVTDSQAVMRWVMQKSGDFWGIYDINVPGHIGWTLDDSEDIYLDCMYPEMEEGAP